MKKKQSDAVVGIVIFTAFLVLMSGVIWLKKISLTQSKVTYTALFPNIGGLKAGDPVRVNGVEKGSVARIYLHKAEVAVRFKIDDNIPYTDSAVITVANVGLMGERALEITLSRAGSDHVPDEGDSISNYIPGYYDKGISEAIGMLGNIMGDAKGLLDTVEYIINSTVGDPDFINFFGSAVTRLDSITLSMDRIVGSNERRIAAIVRDIKSVTGEVDQMLETNSPALTTIVTNTAGLTEDAKSIVNDIDSLLFSLQGVISKVDTGDGTVARLLNDDDLSTEIQGTLTKLDQLVDEADENGLKLRIKLGFKDKKKAEKALEEEVK